MHSITECGLLSSLIVVNRYILSLSNHFNYAGSKHDVQMKVIESSEEEGQIVDKDAEPVPVGEER